MVAHQMLAKSKRMIKSLMGIESSRCAVPEASFMPHICCHVIHPGLVGCRKVADIEAMTGILIAVTDSIGNGREVLPGIFNGMVADPHRAVALRSPSHSRASFIRANPEYGVVELHRREQRRAALLKKCSRYRRIGKWEE